MLERGELFMKARRKIIMLVLVIIILIVIILLGLFSIKIKELTTPTTGAYIKQYENPKKALLVIDLQEGTSGNMGQKANALLEKVNILIQDFQNQELHIIYIKQENKNTLFNRFLFQGNLIQDTKSTEFDKRLQVVNNIEFTKSIQDSFQNQQFEAFLIQNEIDELYIVGIDAKACIYKTALGAKNRNYKTFIVSDAIASTDDENLTEILTKYEHDELDIITANEVSEEILNQ